MWIIILLIAAAVAYASLAGMVQHYIPALAAYMPVPATTPISAAKNQSFAWTGHETLEADGSHTLELSANAQIPAGSQVSLYVGCYRRNAYAYLYPVTAGRQLINVTLNGLPVQTKLDESYRLSVVHPLPEAIIKELPQLHRLAVGLEYQEADGAGKRAETLTFNTTGFGVYSPYFGKDCNERLK